MPTILYITGWRFFFYANEGNEPVHIHCKKGSMECKYWLNREDFGIEEAYSYGLGQNDKRAVKKIIFEYFEFIEQEWDRFMGEVRQ